MFNLNGENLTTRVARLIGSEIVSGQFAPGDVLPNETKLGERFDVGRSAIREAVKLLTSKGLVDARPRRGTAVQPFANWNYLDPDILKWTQGGAPDPGFLADLTEMRLAIEPASASMAAMAAEPEDIERMQRSLNMMKEAHHGIGDPIEADLEFHEAIVAASRNRFMKPLVALIGTALQLSFRVTNAATGRTGGDIQSHERVLDSIRRNDPEQARQAMTDLLVEARTVIRDATEQLRDPRHRGAERARQRDAG